MDRSETVDAQAESLRSLLRAKLGVKRGTLAERAKKAKRRLPTGVHNDIAAVAEAEAMSVHPKIGRRIDPNVTQAAYRRASTFLQAIDVKDRRKGAIMSVLGSVAFNILAVFTLLVIVLRWRGFV